MADDTVATVRPSPVMGGLRYVNLTASALVKTGEGTVVGIFVASSSGGTVKLWDALSAATPVLVNTFSVLGGTWYPVPFHFATGLYVTIAGTVDCTVSYS